MFGFVWLGATVEAGDRCTTQSPTVFVRHYAKRLDLYAMVQRSRQATAAPRKARRSSFVTMLNVWICLPWRNGPCGWAHHW